MANQIKAPRGTEDVLPGESGRWQYVENAALETARLFGFKEIRFPTFEHTELFARGVGDTTDVVQKEMYTFKDKGDRSITLRPEGTAGAMRAVIEHGLLGGALPLKVCYLLSCFRYEKPQAGRLREFHQFGLELIGSASAAADAEVISMMSQFFDHIGLDGISLEINSIGCPKCRAEYTKALREYFSARRDELCETCQGRLERNPMRILDCKSPVCSEISAGAPTVLEYLCDDCRAHFEELQRRLDNFGIEYSINPRIVRGLDYYTRTVFEFVSDCIGAQGTVCGGGRYDGLIEELGGPSTPSIGFAMGLERLLLVMEKSGCEFPPEQGCDIYIGSMGEAASLAAASIAFELRREGFSAECDVSGRSVKAQMKYADKLGAKLSGIIGDSELEKGSFVIKNMRDKSSAEVTLEPEEVISHLYANLMDDVYGALETGIDALPTVDLRGDS